ncbi:hypothetical protein Pmani_018447 [Petrolisthes manimaculis]|uniref:tRNA (adenine(58)-N(1))-methyltransferase n=1 Tax=Petrolisthes manimaculis TaxID=1843537 RepID=A0AAE1U8D7_9EUCA|nr:hypothetical protein Pmani_018447 [Petrolisthes manimaculis]
MCIKPLDAINESVTYLRQWVNMSFSSFKEVIEEGDTIILYINFTQIYALEVKPKITSKSGQKVDNVFQTKYGCLRLMDMVGVRYGSRINMSKGWGHVLYPTPELWTVTLPHRTQILYTPDISMVVIQLEVGPGSVVCEAGTGSGSLSHALMRAIGPTGKLYTCDFHKERVKIATEEFECHGLGPRVNVSERDVCVEGFGVKGVADAVFLDLPKPWEALPHAVSAMKPSGGRVCSFSPCIEQVSRACETMTALGLLEITTLECLIREFQVKTISLPVLSNNGKAVDSQETNVQEDELDVPKKKIKIDDELAEEACTVDDSKVEEQSKEKIVNQVTTARNCDQQESEPVNNVQATFMTGGYSSVRMASTSRENVGVTQRKVSAPPPATAHCPTVPLPQLSRTSFHIGYYVPPAVEPGDPYGGLEDVWNQHFELLFRNLPNMWTFGPAETTPSGWQVFKDMAKVRFSCQRCSHGWTSMYGMVVFYYHWDIASNQGNVRFLLTGQKCNHCNPDGFETPMWYPEEAQKVMTNLYHEVANRVYQLQTPPLIRDRRHGRPRHQHNSSMCQACRQGLCKTSQVLQTVSSSS